MSEHELSNAPPRDDEPAWDEVVALDPEDAAVIQVDPEVDDFDPGLGEFESFLDEEDEEPEVEEEDPDFDDDAEISLLHDLGIDLDAPDGQPVRVFDLDLVLCSEDALDGDDAMEDEVAA